MQSNLKSLQDKIRDLETKLNKVGTSEESQSFAISNNEGPSAVHSLVQTSQASKKVIAQYYERQETMNNNTASRNSATKPASSVKRASVSKRRRDSLNHSTSSFGSVRRLGSYTGSKLDRRQSSLEKRSSQQRSASKGAAYSESKQVNEQIRFLRDEL